ncbi:MAG: VOC family protein [Solobacterium sp.]|nr:VOC family protein [Solobacterium sp.]
MNANIKEIGHVSFKLKNKDAFTDWYQNTLGLKVGFILQKNPGEDYIIYYNLNRGQFIEIFPETSFLTWADYDGNNQEEKYSYQYAVLGTGEGKRMIDPENNKWIVNEGEKYISKVVYHVKNLERSIHFYTDIYELDVARIDDTTAHVIVNEYQVIELQEYDYPENNCTNNKGQCHYALIVNDIVKFAEDMVNKGIQLYHGPKLMNKPYTGPYVLEKHSENTYNFYMQDPDDNEIEVMCYSEDSFQVKYAIQ